MYYYARINCTRRDFESVEFQMDVVTQLSMQTITNLTFAFVYSGGIKFNNHRSGLQNAPTCKIYSTGNQLILFVIFSRKFIFNEMVTVSNNKYVRFYTH